MNRRIKVNKDSLLDLDITNGGFNLNAGINDAIYLNEIEITSVEETLDSISALKPDCDKLDYILASSIGAITGLIDLFLVGAPGESPLGLLEDKKFNKKVIRKAKKAGWNPRNTPTDNNAVNFLEDNFQVCYDQTSFNDPHIKPNKDLNLEGKALNPQDHHFKSLPHNPTLLGLAYSIRDSLLNESHFVVDGEVIPLDIVGKDSNINGDNIVRKVLSASGLWLKHLLSDVSGSSSASKRGAGLPGPFAAWSNDIIAIKHQLNLKPNEFDKAFNELSLQIYMKGYDVRFQAAQTIPVIINSFLCRLVYAIRRLMKYFKEVDSKDRNFKLMWKRCEPFFNPSVRRMLTVSHGVFVGMDLADAGIRGLLTMNVAEFVMRLNIPEIGRFGFSLYGEAHRFIKIAGLHEAYNERKLVILNNYMDGLKTLADIYDDKELLTFTDDIKNTNLYKEAFHKSVELAYKRNVDEDKILKNKSDIDNFFLNGGKNK